MTVAQGQGAVQWEWITLVLSVLTALCIWYFTIAGRDRSPDSQAGQHRVDAYGEIRENHAPVPKFLIWTYIGVGVWAIGYVIYTGINGLF